MLERQDLDNMLNPKPLPFLHPLVGATTPRHDSKQVDSRPPRYPGLPALVLAGSNARTTHDAHASTTMAQSRAGNGGTS